MIVQEIFNTTAVRRIEEQILSLYHETERNHWYNDENKKAIRSLLELRKQFLNSMFVLDEQNKQLLAEFNEAMKLQMAEMRKRAIDLYNNVYRPDMVGHIEVVGKCFMGYEYSKIHPVQTMRAKKMWAVLNGSLDDYILSYHEEGADSFLIFSDASDIESENEFLYLSEEPHNWNEGLDREMTSDLHLTYAFHNLFRHLDFSIYDLLWVRDFNIELHAEIDYHTYESDDYGDELDWHKCDYYD
ncbi:MAG: hypothetical protein IKI44_04775 [Bacteroidaceae bacterium]|nr:hypothetical protein [Bacteroidaceae bacterium]